MRDGGAGSGTAEEISFTIGELAGRTGVGASTIRMWESRHGFPDPSRGAGGHRRYTEADVGAVQAVARLKFTGVRLELAIAQVRAAARPTGASVYADVIRAHPELTPHRLRKRTLVAISHAVEDEYATSWEQGRVWGAFQEERFYRTAQARWDDLARASYEACVLAAFEESDLAAYPREIALPAGHPMLSEWLVAVDAPRLTAFLIGRELPGQSAVPAPDRLFEGVWSVDPAAVRDVIHSCVAVCRAAGHDLEEPADPGRSRDVPPDHRVVSALFNRIVAYADRAWEA